MTDVERDDRLAELLVGYQVVGQSVIDHARSFQAAKRCTLAGALVGLHVPEDTVAVPGRLVLSTPAHQRRAGRRPAAEQHEPGAVHDRVGAAARRRAAADSTAVPRVPCRGGPQVGAGRTRLLALPAEVRAALAGEAFYEPGGCPACDGTGYRGRTGIFEVLKITDGIEALVVQRASAQAIRTQARAEGIARCVMPRSARWRAARHPLRKCS